MRRGFTIEEDEEDAWVGELLSTQQVDVFYSQIEGQFDDRTVLHVGGDVGHQSQVLHQTTSLQTKNNNINHVHILYYIEGYVCNYTK